LSTQIEQALDEQIRDALRLSATPPQERTEQAIPRWTLKRLVEWVKAQFQIDCCRQTICKSLKGLGLSWKKARKLLNKGNTKKRAEYLERIKLLLDKALHNGELLGYIDEAHIHLDTDEGYGWSVKGERSWISSCSPGRAKVSFYGVYIYNLGTVRIFPYHTANGINTIEVLNSLKTEFPHQLINLVWDGAPYHRSQIVLDAAKELEINLQPLSAYSPDFMPVEHLWQWLREDVTYHTCYPSQVDLIQAVSHFQQRINLDPLSLADRLWVKNHLDPDEEKLRFSS
jgi:transposase